METACNDDVHVADLPILGNMLALESLMCWWYATVASGVKLSFFRF